MAARLVAIGDSMTQGFQSLAITHTDLSMPALVADRMGLGMQDFRLPDFKGSGGLPLNLEWLARQLERAWGSDVRFFEWIGATFQIVDLIDQAEDYWEREKGSVPIAPTLYHNLAVWGFEAGDSYQLNAGLCEDRLKETKDNWFSPPSAPRHRTALRVLNPSRDPALDGNTQIGVAKQIAVVEGGIDHLILCSMTSPYAETTWSPRRIFRRPSLTSRSVSLRSDRTVRSSRVDSSISMVFIRLPAAMGS